MSAHSSSDFLLGAGRVLKLFDIKRRKASMESKRRGTRKKERGEERSFSLCKEELLAQALIRT